MEETQDGRNIGFIDGDVRIREIVAVGFQCACLSVACRINIVKPEILDTVHHGRVFEYKQDEFVVFAAVKPVEFAFLYNLAFLRDNTVFVETAL